MDPQFPRIWKLNRAIAGSGPHHELNSHIVDLLVALSRHTDFSVGCYCEDEAHCHRSVLRKLLREAGADIA